MLFHILFLFTFLSRSVQSKSLLSSYALDVSKLGKAMLNRFKIRKKYFKSNISDNTSYETAVKFHKKSNNLKANPIFNCFNFFPFCVKLYLLLMQWKTLETCLTEKFNRKIKKFRLWYINVLHSEKYIYITLCLWGNIL